jgi:hypothetical protein
MGTQNLEPMIEPYCSEIGLFEYPYCPKPLYGGIMHQLCPNAKSLSNPYAVHTTEFNIHALLFPLLLFLPTPTCLLIVLLCLCRHCCTSPGHRVIPARCSFA